MVKQTGLIVTSYSRLPVFPFLCTTSVIATGCISSPLRPFEYQEECSEKLFELSKDFDVFCLLNRPSVLFLSLGVTPRNGETANNEHAKSEGQVCLERVSNTEYTCRARYQHSVHVCTGNRYEQSKVNPAALMTCQYHYHQEGETP